MNKTVILVEDDVPLQKQLIKMLNGEGDIECLFAVGSAEDALKKIPGHHPDVILMDINLPGMSGIDCLPVIRAQVPNAEILMLTAYEDDDNIFRALKAGASGYLLKSSNADEIFDAIRDVNSGGAPFSSHIARKVVRFFRQPAKTDDKAKLSRRETEVLEMLATGLMYKEIADILDLSGETVRTYVKRICTKMHVRGRVEAIIKYHS
ncbi:MAG TPA: response regulator transcription factor [Chthoniobacterales bacterium]|jgi:DNA-binding NarL/FixJ family response regulator|nr:response regulator transcription factor [Chthoniobacterales bacterium]